MLITGTASINTIFHDHLFFSVAERHPWFVRKTEYRTPPAPVPRSGTTAMLLIMSWWTNQKTSKKTDDAIPSEILRCGRDSRMHKHLRHLLHSLHAIAWCLEMLHDCYCDMLGQSAWPHCQAPARASAAAALCESLVAHAAIPRRTECTERTDCTDNWAN